MSVSRSGNKGCRRLDRGYHDFARLYRLAQACAFFVTRARHNTQFDRRSSRSVDRATGLRCQTIRLNGPRSARLYPVPLRRIHYRRGNATQPGIPHQQLPPLGAYHRAVVSGALEGGVVLSLDPKQHLRLKAFYGTTPKPVRIQVWVAIGVYVLVAIAKKQLRMELSLYKILQILPYPRCAGLTWRSRTAAARR